MIYGYRATQTGQFLVHNTICQHCDMTEPQRVSVYSKYAHILWIPLFPFSKVKVAECTSCLRTIKGKEFPSDLRAQADEKLRAVKNPKWQFAGLFIIGALILGSTIIGAISSALAGPPDPRKAELTALVNQMTDDPGTVGDTLSVKTQMLMNIMLTDEIDKDGLTYLSKVQDDRLLFLFNIPEWSRIDNEEKDGFIEFFGTILDSADSVKDMERYIGIYQRKSLKWTSTPAGIKRGGVRDGAPLYPFFGDKPAVAE